MLIKLESLDDRDGTFFQNKRKPAYRPESSKQSNREAHYYKISQDRGYSSITQYSVYADIFERPPAVGEDQSNKTN